MPDQNTRTEDERRAAARNALAGALAQTRALTQPTAELISDGVDPVRATALHVAAGIVASLCAHQPVTVTVTVMQAFTLTLQGARTFEAFMRGNTEDGKTSSDEPVCAP
jgi:hypothetical protein